MSLMVPFSKILCPKNTRCRYCPKDRQIIHKDQLIYDRNSRHWLSPQLTDHNVVKKAHQVCDGILQDHWQCKTQISLVK